MHIYQNDELILRSRPYKKYIHKTVHNNAYRRISRIHHIQFTSIKCLYSVHAIVCHAKRRTATQSRSNIKTPELYLSPDVVFIWMGDESTARS